jgi:HPt (histidine-containing phosphotransfer) domain-containing protein
MCNRPHPPTISAAADGAAPGLDAAAALARVGGNVRLLGELVGFFLEDSDRWLADLAAALERGDAAGVQFTAHLLRGSAANFGAQAACRAGRAVEECARAGDLGGAAGACAELRACLLRLRPALLALAGRATEAPA